MSKENVEFVREGLTGIVDWFNSTEGASEDLATLVERFAAPDIV